MQSIVLNGCLSLVVAGVAVAGFAQNIQVNQNNRTIAVTVTDKATADPDIATIHIGFDVYAPDSKGAYAAGSQTSNAIIDALHKAGVEDKAIESDDQSLKQNTQFDEKESESSRTNKRFMLTQTWTVHASPASAARILHIAVEAGANNSGAIDWDLKDRAGLQAQAAAKALQHAQAMADQMAKGLNAHLGPLLYSSNQAPPVAALFARLQTMASLQSIEVNAVPLSILPHKIEESATVYAVFAIQ